MIRVNRLSLSLAREGSVSENTLLLDRRSQGKQATTMAIDEIVCQGQVDERSRIICQLAK